MSVFWFVEDGANVSVNSQRYLEMLQDDVWPKFSMKFGPFEPRSERLRQYWFQQVGNFLIVIMSKCFGRYCLLARHVLFMTRFGSARVFAKHAKVRDFSTENNIGYLVLLFQIVLVS